jgi:hypothetical protein
MSLQNLANQMQSTGRGGDTMLVHMNPKEVAGLQQLAMAHGGSLTINPETGLPEAGFLSRILPMVVGAGLMMIPGMQPLGAAAITGAGYGVAKGSLKEGLMAGLGAYGGAGLAQGLTAAGADAAGAAVAAPTLTADTAANAATLSSYVPQVQAATNVAATAPWSAAAKGFSALGTEGGRSAFMAGMPAYSGMAAGSGLLGALTPEKQRLGAGTQKSLIRPYTFERTQNQNAYLPRTGTSEQNYFNDSYTALPTYSAPGPEYAAEGGLMGFAVGGPIETMSAMNAVGQNLGYPQSQFQTDIYSNPNVQRPEAMNMIAPSGDVPVDQYTGEQKFASGGKATPETTGGYNYSYDPKTQQFTQLSEPTPVKAKPSGFFGNGIMNALEQMPEGSFRSPLVGGNRGSGVMDSQPETPAKTFTPIVTGGLAQPAMQAQRAAPVQRDIPAYQTPEQQLGLDGFYDYMNQQLAGMSGYQGFAEGGVSHLGGYSDGGRLLRGPGDGVSDSIPAQIGNRQPARLADGEFVVPARIVSELGNGSTEAGARKLYAMMDRVQHARRKSVGKNKVAVNSKADRHLPA